jgi:hypothetical protein
MVYVFLKAMAAVLFWSEREAAHADFCITVIYLEITVSAPLEHWT